MTGLILMAIIAVPIIVLLIASMFGAPRTFKVPALFLGSLVLLTGTSILVLALFSAILGLIVPG